MEFSILLDSVRTLLKKVARSNLTWFWKERCYIELHLYEATGIYTQKATLQLNAKKVFREHVFDREVICF